MNRFIIFDYSPEIANQFSGENLIPRVSHSEDINYAYDDCRKNNSVHCVWLDAPLMSLSDMDFSGINGEIPIVAHVYCIGDTFRVISEIDNLKRISIRIFLSSTFSENFSHIKLLSSLGIDSAILFDSARIDDDAFLDLASYALLGQVPHASIEPFDYIWRNLQDDKNLDFSTLYFENPCRYIYVNSNLDFAFTDKDLKSGKFVGNMSEINEVSFDVEVKEKLSSYYVHFMNLDECSKCPSFKICNRRMVGLFQNCTEAFSTIYEYAEIRSGIEHQNNYTKSLCQL